MGGIEPPTWVIDPCAHQLRTVSLSRLCKEIAARFWYTRISQTVSRPNQRCAVLTRPVRSVWIGQTQIRMACDRSCAIGIRVAVLRLGYSFSRYRRSLTRKRIDRAPRQRPARWGYLWILCRTAARAVTTSHRSIARVTSFRCAHGQSRETVAGTRHLSLPPLTIVWMT